MDTKSQKFNHTNLHELKSDYADDKNISINSSIVKDMIKKARAKIAGMKVYVKGKPHELVCPCASAPFTNMLQRFNLVQYEKNFSEQTDSKKNLKNPQSYSVESVFKFSFKDANKQKVYQVYRVNAASKFAKVTCKHAEMLHYYFTVSPDFMYQRRQIAQLYESHPCMKNYVLASEWYQKAAVEIGTRSINLNKAAQNYCLAAKEYDAPEYLKLGIDILDVAIALGCDLALANKGVMLEEMGEIIFAQECYMDLLNRDPIRGARYMMKFFVVQNDTKMVREHIKYYTPKHQISALLITNQYGYFCSALMGCNSAEKRRAHKLAYAHIVNQEIINLYETLNHNSCGIVMRVDVSELAIGVTKYVEANKFNVDASSLFTRRLTDTKNGEFSELFDSYQSSIYSIGGPGFWILKNHYYMSAKISDSIMDADKKQADKKQADKTSKKQTKGDSGFGSLDY
jgi:tetratricopeptide (TPR) repeat protein